MVILKRDDLRDMVLRPYMESSDIYGIMVWCNSIDRGVRLLDSIPGFTIY